MKDFGKKLLNGLNGLGLYLGDKAWENKWALMVGSLVGWYAKRIYGA